VKEDIHAKAQSLRKGAKKKILAALRELCAFA
jgi:hypothetical protein